MPLQAIPQSQSLTLESSHQKSDTRNGNPPQVGQDELDRYFGKLTDWIED